MAHNRQADLKPNHSSSDEEEEEEEEEEASGSEDEQASDSGSEEVSDSDSEPKPKHEPKKPLNPPRQSATKLQPPDPSSSETEESGSDTDSDLPPKKSIVADPNIKPISSKPMEREEVANVGSKLAKKSGSKVTSVPPPSKAKRPPSTPGNEKEKDAKKAKKSVTTDDDSKKQLFQRLWSEDDEIVVLKGMIDYKNEKHGENPVADMGAFHEFIKKSLHVDVSRAQLVDKVRRLKKKYVNNVGREKNGKDRSFSKSHEQKGYELSKLIWGNSSHNSGAESKKIQTQKNGGAKANANVPATGGASTSIAVGLMKTNGVDEKEGLSLEVENNMDVSRFVQYGRMNYSPVMEEEIIKAGLELVEGSKREELKEKWNKLKLQELQLYVQRMDLIKEQAAVVFEAMNSSGN